MSLLDAAYEVLKKSGCPMSPADIIRPVLESGMWTTKGKTPEQTLGARLYVDIKKLGAKSRFVNVGNGRFALSRPEGVSSKMALVYDGHLSPLVEADGYFDAIVPFKSLLGLN